MGGRLMAWWEWDSVQTPPADVDTSPAPVYAVDGPTKIMALGDSITRGQGGESQGGYRGPLWDALRADGHAITPVGGMGDIKPAGYQAEGGWRTEDQAGTGARNLHGFNAQDQVRSTRPHIILAHLGTNSVANGITEAQLADYISTYRALLDDIYAFVPRAHVFVARIVLAENQWDGTRMYNDRVQEMVESYVAKGRPYHLVTGMESMPAGSWADGLHPNAQGYDYMATVWKTALDAAAQT